MNILTKFSFLIILLASCNSTSKNEIVNEIEQKVKIKLPSDIELIESETEFTPTDNGSKTTLKILGKESISNLLAQIKTSKEYVVDFPVSIPNDTSHYYWTNDKQFYVYSGNGFGLKYMTFSLDTITGDVSFTEFEE